MHENFSATNIYDTIIFLLLTGCEKEQELLASRLCKCLVQKIEIVPAAKITIKLVF